MKIHVALQRLKLVIAACGALAPFAPAAPVHAATAPAAAPPAASWPQPAPEQCRRLADFATVRTAGDALRETLAALPEAPTALLQAEIVAAVDDLPEVCRVSGIVAPDIQFELRMPTRAWNGKFMHYGCGGACGVVYRPQLDEALSRGYAVVASDMGHSGAPTNWLFMYANLQAVVDFAYRATHVVTIAAKAVVASYYGIAPRYSYFMGCSTGGVQGVIEAQRYPQDFDGIIAGAPAYSSGPTFIEWGMRANLDAEDRGIVDPAKLPMLRKAVLARCDRLDGYVDGILQDPRACDFDPGELQCAQGDAPDCLSAAEVTVVRKLYAGPSTSEGASLAYGQGGLSKGSEYDWSSLYVRGKGVPSIGNPFGFTIYGNGVYPVAAANAGKPYDYDADPKRGNLYYMGQTLGWLRYAGNPDLRRFRDQGGKLILWHGWDDMEVAPGASADYYEITERAMGGRDETQKFFRLFMLPGVAHCRRGPGCDAVDWITYLERWVEQGQAPDEVISHHLVKEQNYLGLPRPRYPLPAGSFDHTRPVYPYPAIAQYRGRGDPAQASSWRQGELKRR